MSTAWSIFVIVLVVINVGGCGWLIWWTMHMRTDEQAEGELSTGHTWDGDLKENNNPLPKWWRPYTTLLWMPSDLTTGHHLSTSFATTMRPYPVTLRIRKKDLAIC